MDGSAMGIAAVSGISVGHATVPGGGSGCTVILGPFRGRVEVPGMASGSRELEVLRGTHVTNRADAILLTGGSAFGLAAADGVMGWLEDAGRGHSTPAGPVPIVPTGVIYDLAPDRRRPGPAEGRAACEAAARSPSREATDSAGGERAGSTGAAGAGSGAVGAGTGARVGKILGRERSAPGGVGSTHRRWGRWTLGALAVVNALGEVVDRRGRVVAGPEGTQALLEGTDGDEEEGGSLPFRQGENTTLGVVATDAPLTGEELERVLRVAATALPRRISPAYTPFDGDMVFAVSTGEEGTGFTAGEILTFGVMLREALEDAILDAVGGTP